MGFVFCILRDRARDLWEEVGRALGDKVVMTMTWTDFLMRLGVDFAPAIEVQLLAREFQNMCQMKETMTEITTEFRERALLVPHYVADNEMRKMRYHDIFMDDIREFVRISSFKMLNDMIACAQEWEIELELYTKCKREQVYKVVGPAKKPNNFDP